LEEEEEEIPLDYGLCQDIGDLEEMPIFGKSRDATLNGPMDCEGTFLEQEEIHAVGQRHTELQSRNCSPSDAKMLDSDTECDDGGRNFLLGWEQQDF
jgi:hypothetical protein